MKKIIANKTWQDPKKREVSDGNRKKLPVYRQQKVN